MELEGNDCNSSLIRDLKITIEQLNNSSLMIKSSTDIDGIMADLMEKFDNATAKVIITCILSYYNMQWGGSKRVIREDSLALLHYHSFWPKG